MEKNPAHRFIYIVLQVVFPLFIWILVTYIPAVNSSNLFKVFAGETGAWVLPLFEFLIIVPVCVWLVRLLERYIDERTTLRVVLGSIIMSVILVAIPYYQGSLVSDAKNFNCEELYSQARVNCLDKRSFDLAVATVDSTACRGMSTQIRRELCITNVASLASHPALCFDIINANTRTYCLYSTIEAPDKVVQASQCENLPPRISMECQGYVMYKHGESCGVVSSREMQDACVSNVAALTADPGKCFAIFDEGIRKNCLSQVSTDKPMSVESFCLGLPDSVVPECVQYVKEGASAI